MSTCEHCGKDIVAHHARNLKCPDMPTIYREARAAEPAPKPELTDVRVSLTSNNAGESCVHIRARFGNLFKEHTVWFGTYEELAEKLRVK